MIKWSTRYSFVVGYWKSTSVKTHNYVYVYNIFIWHILTTNAIYLNRIEIFHIEFEFVDFNTISVIFLDSFLTYTLIDVSYTLASVLFYIVYIGERKYRMFERRQDDEFPVKLISYREINQTSATSNFCHNRREKKCYWEKT